MIGYLHILSPRGLLNSDTQSKCVLNEHVGSCRSRQMGKLQLQEGFSKYEITTYILKKTRNL